MNGVAFLFLDLLLKLKAQSVKPKTNELVCQYFNH